MPRSERTKSQSGIYHVIIRGINRQDIFHEEDDYNHFLWTLRHYTKCCEYEIYAYCLMSNHVHILLREGSEPLGVVFRRIGASYVYWYNAKYDRTGHLFQDRFKSEPVEDARYFLVALRYIHLNPVKACLCSNPEEYHFSSYSDYYRNPLIQTKPLRELMSDDEFICFHHIVNEDCCLDIPDNTLRKKLTDSTIQAIMKDDYGLRSPADFLSIDKPRQEMILRQLHHSGASIRQLSRLTGMTQYHVYNSCR